MNEVEARKIIKAFRSIAHDMKSEIKEQKRTQTEINKELAKTLARLESMLHKVKYEIECVDETLGLAMVAIKQNEFLHTHYPEQHGYPEMKIAGKHPAKWLDQVASETRNASNEARYTS